jgi:hypothetical protein
MINIIVTCNCVQGGVSQLLQLNVMHNLSKITSWHVCSLNVVRVLHIQTKQN